MSMKKLISLAAIVCSLSFADVSHHSLLQGNVCSAAVKVSNNGTYTATSQSVSIYTEAGHPKGSFTVYLHQGKKYVKFQNTWICIQGKSRFAYNGNWYVIK